MIILITGASHTGKTVLAQKLMEESADRDGRTDDCTAVVLTVRERE